MISQAFKNSYFLLALIIILGCQENDRDAHADYLDIVYFSGSIDNTSEQWQFPEYQSYPGLIDFSPYNDSARYSFHAFNLTNRITLLTRDIREEEFDDFFSPGEYTLGEDYHIIFKQGNEIYQSKQEASNDFQLIQTKPLSGNLVNCIYLFACTLYDDQGNPVYQIDHAEFSVVFTKRVQNKSGIG